MFRFYSTVTYLRDKDICIVINTYAAIHISNPLTKSLTQNLASGNSTVWRTAIRLCSISCKWACGNRIGIRIGVSYLILYPFSHFIILVRSIVMMSFIYL